MTDEQLEEHIRCAGTTFWHVCGTCKMGVTEDAVVDPQLQVRGVSNLRVIIASVMPSVIRGKPTQPS